MKFIRIGPFQETKEPISFKYAVYINAYYHVCYHVFGTSNKQLSLYTTGEHQKCKKPHVSMASLFTEHINVRKSNSNIYKLTVIVFANLG